MKQFSVVGMDHRSEKRVGRLMKKNVCALVANCRNKKKPVITKKKTTTTSKNKTKMTTKNNIKTKK